MGGAATVTIALVSDMDGTEAFLADVATMLERIAVRAGQGLTLIAASDDARTYEVPDTPATLSAIEKEVGIHRAQVVPPESPSGRVNTYKVSVTLHPARSGEAPTDVLKTYNYMQKKVRFHRSGLDAPLDEVLGGQVGRGILT